jgi:uncharacterized membrane protein YeaQ/YmgE (transglycosylase-associated protein family)
MGINGIISTITGGAIIGGLDRLASHRNQRITLVVSILIGIVAAMVSMFVAAQLDVGSRTEFFIQLGLATTGVTICTGGGHSRESSPRR